MFTNLHLTVFGAFTWYPVQTSRRMKMSAERNISGTPVPTEDFGNVSLTENSKTSRNKVVDLYNSTLSYGIICLTFKINKCNTLQKHFPSNHRNFLKVSSCCPTCTHIVTGPIYCFSKYQCPVFLLELTIFFIYKNSKFGPTSNYKLKDSRSRLYFG